jgi:hypothetical protein
MPKTAVLADPERERDQRDQGEGGLADQRPKRVPEVLKRGRHGSASAWLDGAGQP